MKWEDKGRGMQEAQFVWDEPPYGPLTCTVWIQKRPDYCDRSRYVAMTSAPLDHQEGWPRYYFELDTAKKEIEFWAAGRKEIPK